MKKSKKKFDIFINRMKFHRQKILNINVNCKAFFISFISQYFFTVSLFKLNNIQLLNIICFRNDEFLQQTNYEIQVSFQTLQNIVFQIHQKNVQIIQLF